MNPVTSENPKIISTVARTDKEKDELMRRPEAGSCEYLVSFSLPIGSPRVPGLVSEHWEFWSSVTNPGTRVPGNEYTVPHICYAGTFFGTLIGLHWPTLSSSTVTEHLLSSAKLNPCRIGTTWGDGTFFPCLCRGILPGFCRYIL